MFKIHRKSKEALLLLSICCLECSFLTKNTLWANLLIAVFEHFWLLCVDGRNMSLWIDCVSGKRFIWDWYIEANIYLGFLKFCDCLSLGQLSEPCFNSVFEGSKYNTVSAVVIDSRLGASLNVYGNLLPERALLKGHWIFHVSSWSWKTSIYNVTNLINLSKNDKKWWKLLYCCFVLAFHAP